MENDADDLIERVNAAIQCHAELCRGRGWVTASEQPTVVVAVDEAAEVHAHSVASAGVTSTGKDLVERIVREMCAQPSRCRRSERP